MNKSKLPSYWEKAKQIYAADPLERVCLTADNLLEECKRLGHLEVTPRQALEVDLASFILFYEALFHERPQLIRGPAQRNSDAGWMIKRDFCFLNVRAVGTTPESTGTFMDAVKLIPVIRCDAFHLAPFFDCAFENLYAIESLRTITDAVVDLEAEKQGLTRNEQLKIFIDACHLLDKAVGFDLEPHTSQFSRVVLENPGHFRWIKLSKDKFALANNLSMEEMLFHPTQSQIIKQVKTIVQKLLQKHSLAHLESGYPEDIRKVHGEIVSRLIEEGYWTIPSHTWNGAGLPRFKGYHEQGYPLFEYLNIKGENHDDHAFGTVTPYKFYDNLPINACPTPDNPPVTDVKTVDLFLSIFPRIRREWSFDFVRLDYADHIFDAQDAEHGFPLSDRMTPSLLKSLTNRLRIDCPGIGVMAESMGEEIEEYAHEGVNLVLGWEIFSLLNNRYASDGYRLCQKVEQLSEKHLAPASIMFAVDTHDSENPLFWKTGPARLLGAKGMLFRLFWARFGNAGSSRRPKYEAIGNQDLSSGLYEANNRAVSLAWKNDMTFNAWYHRLENVYDQLRDFLESAHVSPPHGYGPVKYWFMDGVHPEIKRLICIAYVGIISPEATESHITGQFEDLKTCNRPITGFRLDPFTDLPSDNQYRLTGIDLLTEREELLKPSQDFTLTLPELALHEVKLIKVT